VCDRSHALPLMGAPVLTVQRLLALLTQRVDHLSISTQSMVERRVRPERNRKAVKVPIHGTRTGAPEKPKSLPSRIAHGTQNCPVVSRPRHLPEFPKEKQDCSASDQQHERGWLGRGYHWRRIRLW